MSNFQKKFPKKFAIGDAFCNRTQERKNLVSNILNAQHTLIIGPRRYGKSSLGLAAINDAKVPFERVDFFIAVDEKSAVKLAVEGIKGLLAQISTPTDKILRALSNFVKKLQLDWVIGTNGVSIQLVEKDTGDYISLIHNMLKILEYALGLQNTQAVLFLDEFQEIGKLNLSKGLEAAIRNVAESSEHLTFIFSGSSRNLLHRMFNDDNSPLYKLCDKMNITRISENHFRQFIGKYAKQTWRADFQDEAYRIIFELTERHQYYVNALCRLIWSTFQHHKNPPNPAKIADLWETLLDQDLDEIADKINMLNLSQKKILIEIAKGNISQLSTKTMLAKMDLSSGAVSKALNILKAEDYIENTEAGFRIINPQFKSALLRFFG